MNWQSMVKSVARSAARTLVPHIKREALRQLNQRGKPRDGKPHLRTTKNAHTSGSSAQGKQQDRSSRLHTTSHNPVPEGFPQPGDRPLPWSFAERGLPNFEYRPERDGAPDPGEVVWTWVPFEENDGRGKDRPVLVVAMEGEYVIFGQMTSKDHAKGKVYQDRFDRWWIDLGAGEWDSQGRPSELRLDVLWIVHEDQVRRGGGKLPEEKFKAVVAAIAKING
ncbi:MAG: type II toxin-antitoxin system PemK/MazF family toxin [Arcanobacterium sp.]|nr:type II toxin-antitoxin system PemK/MazF family toxin [Arcanobacterium sp.]